MAQSPAGGEPPAKPRKQKSREEPAAAVPGAAADGGDQNRDRIGLGRSVAPPDLNDPERRQALGLPKDEQERGDYMIELNVANRGGLQAAESRFREIYQKVIGDPKVRPYVKVGQTYYHCLISVMDWHRLIEADEKDANGKVTSPGERAIYRIWPDFPIRPQINRSVATIKADAALRSYEASGADIVWVVSGSGIDGDHPHFGLQPGRGHTLLDPAVADLHRDFSRLDQPDPDERPDDGSPSISPDERKKRVADHRANALTDDFGHGTHVAGIIAGGFNDKTAPQVDCRVFERKFSLDDQDRRKPTTMEERTGDVDAARLRGMAPNCRLISLKVLDGGGNGRTSNVIRALDYIRANMNANPKRMLAHGVNLSLGYEFDAQIFACGQSPLCVEVDRLVQSGVVVVTAAGNTGYGTILAQERPTSRV